jgi:hypothetical protein
VEVFLIVNDLKQKQNAGKNLIPKRGNNMTNIYYTIRRYISDFIFERIKQPYWTIKFIFKHRCFLVPWEMTDSVIDFAFKQFKDFYGHYTIEVPEDWRRFGKREIGFYEDDLKEIKKGNWEVNHIAYKESIKQRIRDYKELENIYIYITSSRDKNQKIADDLLEDMYKDSKWDFHPIKESDKAKETDKAKDFFEIVEKGEIHHFKLSWKFNAVGEALVKRTEIKKHSMDWYDFEEALKQKDNEFVNKIIDLRGYLWD